MDGAIGVQSAALCGMNMIDPVCAFIGELSGLTLTQ